MKICYVVLCVVAFLRTTADASAPNLQALAREFFAWRAMQQPATNDDVNRVERPDGWTPDWSPQALKEYSAKQKDFLRRLKALQHNGWTVADSVDFLLLRSAISRVEYELNIIRLPRRNPHFYTQQTLGAVYELILQPPPFSESRAQNIVLRLESIPKTLKHARTNLIEPVGVFAQRTIEDLENVKSQLARFSGELVRFLPQSFQARFVAATKNASENLVAYREWLKQKRPVMKNQFAIGTKAYSWYLKYVALNPYTSDELLRMGQTEWERSVAFEQYEKLRNAGLPPLEVFPTAAAQIDQEKRDEQAIRDFVAAKGILDIPQWMGHYWNQRMPAYVEPLRWLGVSCDHTSPSRLGENGISYILDPSPGLPFFRLSTAQDPRPIVVHEGIPGHFCQLTWSWSNPDTIRQKFFDSGPIEGIGFYAEETLLQYGLFDDKPRTREIIYRFMRLRALRVDVDIKLARGDYSIDDAMRYLAQTVPMDEATARQEVADFAAGPGQAITYQIGKMQVIKLIADAKIQLGEKFKLTELHNYMWLNGNVPLALQRWEYLGLRDEIVRLL
jgi:uncharacterized protein (DUF885 family)